MAEITADGYTRLRTNEVGTWFVELRDDSNQPVPLDDGAEGSVNRVAVADDRVTVTDNTGTQTITFAVALTATDVTPESVTLPVTVEGVVAYAAVSGGNPLTQVETFTPFTFADPADELTVRLHVEVPEQA